MQKTKVIPTLLSASLLIAISGLYGCGGSDNSNQQNAANDAGLETLNSDLQEQNFFLVIEQTAENPDRYVLAERHETSGDTRAVLKKLDGSEAVMSNEDLKALAEAEAKKVEAGTSALTQEASAESGGLGLGEMILASAAGSLIGGMLASRLSQNNNFKRNQQANTKPAAAITKTAKQRPKPSSKQKAQPSSKSKRSKGGFSFGKKRRR